MLRARTLARMRAQSELLMSQTATISRPGAATVDSSGHWTEGTPTTSSSACRLISAANSRVSAIVGEQDGTREFYQLILPYNADIDSGDRVTVDSIVYEILNIEERHSDIVSVQALVTPLLLQSDV